MSLSYQILSIALRCYIIIPDIETNGQTTKTHNASDLGHHQFRGIIVRLVCFMKVAKSIQASATIVPPLNIVFGYSTISGNPPKPLLFFFSIKSVDRN